MPICFLLFLCYFSPLFFHQFAKDSGKYVEEKKLRVVLVTPPPSPVLLPINGDSKQDACNDTSTQKENVPSGVENINPAHKVRAYIQPCFLCTF